jgi:hypothetical protein
VSLYRWLVVLVCCKLPTTIRTTTIATAAAAAACSTSTTCSTNPDCCHHLPHCHMTTKVHGHDTMSRDSNVFVLLLQLLMMVSACKIKYNQITANHIDSINMCIMLAKKIEQQ